MTDPSDADYIGQRSAQRDRVISNILDATIALKKDDPATAQANALIAIARLLFLRETEVPSQMITFPNDITAEEALAIRKKLADLRKSQL